MSFSIEEILSWIQGTVVNPFSISGLRVEKISPLASSQPSNLSFFFSRAFEKELVLANPGILVTAEAFVQPLSKAGLPFWKTAAVVTVADPYYAMALLSEKFASVSSSVAHLPKLPKETIGKKPQVHPTAVIAPTAILGEGVAIGPHCVVEDGVRIGKNTVLYPGCVIGPQSSIGSDCVLFPRVTLYEWTQIGNRVRIHAGVVLGADGFGYAPKRDASLRIEGHQKIYHLGQVIIEDDVEIGANSCVDRGTFGETRIEQFAKLDNLVQIGHNARLEKGAIICGGTCLAGNSRVGKFAYVGGLSGIANHISVGEGAKVGALSLVTKNVPPGGTAVGNPQRNYKEHFRVHAFLSKQLSGWRKKSDG